MLRWSRWTGNDEGSAALEFLTAGLILLVPLVYLVVTLGLIQQQTLGVEAAARHSARAISQASDPDAAADRGRQVLSSVIDEYGLDPDAVEVSMSCVPAGEGCPAAGATVIVTVSTVAPLPLVPSVLGLDRAASVPIEATSSQRLPRMWGAG